MGDFIGRVRKLVDLWIEAFGKHDLLTYASAIAFHVLKSLIPLALLGLAILGAVGRKDVWTTNIAPALQKRVNPSAYHAVDFAAKKIFAHQSVPLLVFASWLTVWYVSGGVRGIMGGINRIYEVDETRSFTTRWPISFALALCVVAGIVGAAMLVEVVPTPGGALGLLVRAVRWIGAILLLALAARLLVRFAPVQRRSKRWANVGGLLVVVTWIVTTIVFRWYVASVANFKTAIGQLTVFIVLMVYVYASSIVLLVGVEVDEMLRQDASADERGILDVLLDR